ncbi:MAG TPA: hypothetical protein VNJ07_03445 [Chitinophagales bacterium]|nr:hypothetical protein [Chitinophagales bacterium]
MKEYLILISAVDNRLIITLNDKEVYDSELSHKPLIFEPPLQLPITHLLQPEGDNLLTFDFYNGGITATDIEHSNPYHFEYRIVERSTDDIGGHRDKDVVPRVMLKDVSKPCIWLTPKRYSVKKEGEAFVFCEVKPAYQS